MLVALFVILVLLTWDWVVKKRRVSARPDLSDQEFLGACRSCREMFSDTQILEVRQRLARELGLPAPKLRPGDLLTELRDRYCLVVSGHLALTDLYDDLEAEGAVEGSESLKAPATIGGYIASFLARSARARHSP